MYKFGILLTTLNDDSGNQNDGNQLAFLILLARWLAGCIGLLAAGLAGGWGGGWPAAWLAGCPPACRLAGHSHTCLASLISWLAGRQPSIRPSFAHAACERSAIIQASVSSACAMLRSQHESPSRTPSLYPHVRMPTCRPACPPHIPTDLLIHAIHLRLSDSWSYRLPCVLMRTSSLCDAKHRLKHNGRAKDSVNRVTEPCRPWSGSLAKELPTFQGLESLRTATV